MVSLFMNLMLSFLQAVFMFVLVSLTLSLNESFPLVGIIDDTFIFADGNLYIICFKVSEHDLVDKGPDLLSLTPVCRNTSFTSG